LTPDITIPSDEYLARRYKTILVSVIFIGGTWFLYLPDAPLPTAATITSPDVIHFAPWVISGALLLLGGVAIFGAGSVSFGERDIAVSNNIRHKLLPTVTIFFMIILGAMISASGGAVNSGFSHYLGATSSVALILAERFRNRIIILGATCSIYWATSVWIFGGGTAMPGFNRWCFVVSVILAAIAGWRNAKTLNLSKSR
jgi:hypothetical protein